jgi:hypothetical protein
LWLTDKAQIMYANDEDFKSLAPPPDKPYEPSTSPSTAESSGAQARRPIVKVKTTAGQVGRPQRIYCICQ